MEILCHVIASYGDDVLMWCVIVNLVNLGIAKTGAEPDIFIIGMFSLGIALIVILAILVLLGTLGGLGMLSGCLQDVFK